MRNRRTVTAAAAVLLAAVLLTSGGGREGGDGGTASYSSMLQAVRAGEVTHVTLDTTTGRATGETDEGVRIDAAIPPGDLITLADELDDAGADVTVVRTAPTTLFERFVLPLLPILLIAAVILAISRRNGGGLVGRMPGRRAEPAETPETRFTDVGGQETTVAELREAVHLLTDPDSYVRAGARPPRGILLVGPPGNGKTLMARAVAGEAGVPFYAVSGSDFVELFAGLGASRVRNMFAAVRRHERAILFIDELDAVGKRRGSALQTGANDERENTLNQLLVEMDGFDGRPGILIIAATNRSEILDEALTRPGRFDRTIPVRPPDLAGRAEILRIAAAALPENDVDWDSVARRTPGASGAQLRQIVNEAAMQAARAGRESITGADVAEAVSVAIAGRAEPGRAVHPRDDLIAAWHEAGHTLVAEKDPDAAGAVEASVVPRGQAGGVTFLGVHDHSLATGAEMRARLRVALGGIAAERLLLDGDHTTGGHGDLAQATALAGHMIREAGMGGDLRRRRDPAETLASDDPEGDAQVEGLLRQALDEATVLLQAERPALERLAAALQERRTLTADEISDVIAGYGQEPAEDLRTADAT